MGTNWLEFNHVPFLNYHTVEFYMRICFLLLRHEEKVKKMERSILTLIEESCLANNRGDFSLALQKAREASNRERHIMHLQGETGLSEGHNLDITYAVSCFSIICTV